MKLNEMSPQLTPVVAKKATKTVNAVKQGMRELSIGKASVTMNVMSPLKVEIIVEFPKWLDSSTIRIVYDEFERAIKNADVDGHIQKLELGNGVGEEFVEALLQGLKPGMKLNAEAFFPTFAYEITWQNILPKK